MVLDLYFGLGNQMFIYAFGEYCRIIKGMNVCYNIAGFAKNSDAVKRRLDLKQFPNVKIKEDTFFYQPNFHTYRNVLDYIGKKMYLKIKRYTIKKEGLLREFDKNLVSNLSNEDYVFGFFQTEDYLKEIENQIRFDFEFPELESVKPLIEIIEKEKDSVSLHIRRGDYLNDANFRVLNIDYYKQAINKMISLLDNPYFFIFTDDEKWVTTHFNAVMNGRYMVVKGNTGFEDMMLMSKCKHNIIANSSFSWWGGWLNKNPIKIVIAPSDENWYKNPKWLKKKSHYCPQKWLRI